MVYTSRSDGLKNRRFFDLTARPSHVVSILGVLHEGAYFSVRVVVLRRGVDDPLRCRQRADRSINDGREEENGEEAGQEDFEHEEEDQHKEEESNGAASLIGLIVRKMPPEPEFRGFF